MNPIIYGIFPELDRFIVESVGAGIGNTVANISGDFVRAGVRCENASAIARTPSIGPRSDVWWHFLANPSNRSTADSSFFQVLDSINGQEIMEIEGNNGTYFLEVSLNGTTYVVSTATGTFGGVSTPATLLEFDVHLVINPVGDSTIEVFVNQVLALTYTGPLSPTAQYADSVRIQSSITFNGDTDFFELHASDSPTFGNRIASNPIIATALPNDFGGLVSDIAAIDSDNTAVMTTAPGDEQAFVLGDLSAVAGTLNPIAVFVQATGQPDGITNSFDVGLQSPTGSRSTQNNPLAGGFETMEASFDFNNPFTGMPWTVADIDGLEAFFRGVA